MTERLLPGTAIDIEKGMRLKAGQVGFGTVLFQSVAHIAPALALIFALTVGVQYAGAALPLSTLLGFIGIMAVAFCVGQLARVLPAAGYYMTWTGKSIGPRFGFMAGWFVLMSEAIPMGGLYLIMGTTFGAFLGSYATFSIHWLIIDIVLAAAVGFLLWRGIKVSGTAGVILGTLEITILGVLIVWLIVKAGSHNTLSVFTPGAPGVSHRWVGVLRAVIYAVPTFAGFETAAVLAEESREPRRFIPRAVVLATFACGVFFVAGAYAGVIAWGPSKIAGYASSSNAWQALAHSVWGFAGALLIFLALINSIAGNSSAEATASTRLMYAMGRIGSLPRWLGAVHTRLARTEQRDPPHHWRELRDLDHHEPDLRRTRAGIRLHHQPRRDLCDPALHLGVRLRAVPLRPAAAQRVQHRQALADPGGRRTDLHRPADRDHLPRAPVPAEHHPVHRSGLAATGGGCAHMDVAPSPAERPGYEPDRSGVGS